MARSRTLRACAAARASLALAEDAMKRASAGSQGKPMRVRLSRLAVLSALGVALACSSKGARSPQGGPPYLGRWVARLAGAPCPYDFELMPGGAARSNFLSDDSPDELCRQRDVTFAVGSLAPDSLTFLAGERAVRHCWFALSGPHLDLACDEHGPPERGTPPIRFSRVEAPPPAAGASIVGDWNDGSMRFSFLPDGICVVGGRRIGYKIVSDREIELLWPRPERCTYEFRGGDQVLLSCASMSLDLRR